MSSKNLGIVVALMLGCAVGATMPRTTAQASHSYASRADTQRWEQWCKLKGGLGHGDRRAVAVERINNSLRTMGAQGWEFVSAPVAVGDRQGSVTGDILLCFRRPAE